MPPETHLDQLGVLNPPLNRSLCRRCCLLYVDAVGQKKPEQPQLIHLAPHVFTQVASEGALERVHRI